MNLPLRWCAVTVSEWSSGQCDTIPHSSDPLHFRRTPNWQVALGRWVWTVGYIMCIEEQLEYPAWTTLQTSLRFSQTIHPKMFISLASRPRRHHVHVKIIRGHLDWLFFHMFIIYTIYMCWLWRCTEWADWSWVCLWQPWPCLTCALCGQHAPDSRVDGVHCGDFTYN